MSLNRLNKLFQQ